jgi:hypothetical protein
MKLPPQVAAVLRQDGAALPPAQVGIEPQKIKNIEGHPATDWVSGVQGLVHYFHCKAGYHWSRCDATHPFYDCCPEGKECVRSGKTWKCV